MDLNSLTAGQPEKLVLGMAPKLGQCRSVEEACQALCRELYEHCRSGPDGERTLVLSRAFLSIPYQSLDPETLSHVRVPRNTDKDRLYFMTLLGTYGRAPAWCERRLSARHRALPFDRAKPPRHPMWENLFEQVGFDAATLGAEHDELWIPRDLFLVEDAQGHEALPSQEEFIKPLGVQSVVGSAAVLPDGSLAAWVGFSRHRLTAGGALPLLSLMPTFCHVTHPLYRRRAYFT